MSWHYVERGEGRPLVLLHGIGMSHRAWLPVMERLARERRVLAFDTAGFGDSPCLPDGIPPTTENLARELERVLRRLGIEGPVDIAGNSMGGWMALEAARLGLARSVVAISPAGLWRQPPARARHVFFGLRRVARTAPWLVKGSLRVPLLRELLMAVPLSTGGRDIPADIALDLTWDFVKAPGFEATFAHSGRFADGQGITSPVTVAFGTHDLLLGQAARLRGELPAQARWLEPEGWGHVPMWKDPAGVAKLILEGTV